MWAERREAVEEELKSMLNVTSIDWSYCQVFEKRVTACKNVLNRMTIQERAEHDAVVEKWKNQGNPENLQCS